jgi:ligand-binding sensor domain-containing protein
MASLRSISNKQGLSQGFVSSITQDQQGYMWFATKDGLNRYDGVHMKVYRKENGDMYSLPENNITHVVADTRNGLWVGIQSHGLVYMDEEYENFYSIKQDDEQHLIGNQITNLQIHDQWLAVQTPDDFCIYEIQGKKSLHRILSYVGTQKSNLVLPFYWSTQNAIYSWSKDSLYVLKWDSHQWKTSSLSLHEFHMNDQKVVSMFEGSEAHITIAIGSNTLTVFDWLQHKIIFEQTFSDKNSTWESYWYNKAFETRHGLVYFIDGKNYLSFDDGTKTFKRYTFNDKFWFSGISHYLSRDGHLWIGTGGYGVYVYNTKRERFHTLPDEVSSFFEDEKQNVYVQFRSEGLKKLDLITHQKKFVFEDDPNQKDTSTNTLIAFDKPSEVLAIRNFLKPHTKIFKYNFSTQKETQSSLLHLDSTKSFGVFYNFYDRQHHLWYLFNSTSRGRFLIETEGRNTIILNQYTLPIPPDSNVQSTFINSQFEDDDGNLWFTSMHGLLHLNRTSKTWKIYLHDEKNSESLPGNSLLCLSPDLLEPDNYFWIGTNGDGFCKFDKRTGHCTSWSVKEGLPNNVVYSVIPDSSGHVWCSTNQGLACFDIKQKSFTNYNEEDGLPGNEFNTQQFYKTKNGTLLFGGVNGLVWFNPEDINASSKIESKLVFTGISFGNQRVDHKKDSTVLQQSVSFAPRISLPPNQKMFGVHYALLEYSSAEKKQFQYKLEGFDSKWIDNGSSSSIYFTNLEAGNYTLYVKGRNAHGAWNIEPSKLLITVLAPWYKQVWFKLLVLAMLLLLFYFFYRYRLAQTKKMLNLRNVIAADLHDEIGSTISSISLYSDILVDHMTDDKLKQVADRISGSSKEVIKSMGDIVWAVNPKNDLFENIILRMKAVAYEMTEAKKIKLIFEVAPELSRSHLNMEQRKNFYLVFKEGLNNAVKYAAARTICIRVSQEEKNLCLCIEDDGIGFNRHEIQEGNGLDNMAHRSKELKGTLLIESQVGKGTLITLKFKPE